MAERYGFEMGRGTFRIEGLPLVHTPAAKLELERLSPCHINVLI